MGRHKPRSVSSCKANLFASPCTAADIEEFGFPLVPDNPHLRHVGKTAQGNGYWIAPQLAVEDGDTRDFVAAYVFDTSGKLIFCEVVDQGIRAQPTKQSMQEIVQMLEWKIDAKESAEVLVKPISRSFYGHHFGLIIREQEEGKNASEEILVAAMPGSTLMFHGPWSHCNYES